MDETRFVPAVGSRWQKVGRDEPVRVIGNAAGYAVVRYKGCMPFCVWWKQLQDEYELVSPAFPMTRPRPRRG